MRGGRKEGSVTHGMHGTYVYRKWMGMKVRCDYPSTQSYATYGGAGIKVCDRWRSFENFFADMGHPPEVGYELDRIDNSKGYEPDNCRWVTRSENCRNRRSNRIVEIDGVSKCIAAWCEETGIRPDTALWRLNHGWPPREAFSRAPKFANRWDRVRERGDAQRAA